jgi:two-component system CheB/CheR fusion protein
VGLSKEQLARWFTEVPGGWAVRKEIRRLVVFGVNNLVSDAPISRLDLLVCRNVFIYLDSNLQRRVLGRFHYALKRDGVLVLGKSELIPFAAKIFESIDLPHRIHRKNHRREMPSAAHERLLGIIEQEDVTRNVGRSGSELAALEQFHRNLLDSLHSPVIATALDGTVTSWNAAARALWGRSDADVLGKKLPSLGLPGLTGELLIEKSASVREGKAARVAADGVVQRGGDKPPLAVSVEVSRLCNLANELVGLVYVVTDVTAVRELQEDLRRMQEERHSANEELQTMNEELQSTNEELETTNEELQSANEELDATNRELAHRTDEMNLLSFYHRTIVRSLSAAVVVLDENGRITIWNLAAERLLGLPEGEALGQLFWSLRVPALRRSIVDRVRKSLAKRLALRMEDLSYELPAGRRAYGSLAAVPLVDRDAYLGAVVLFEDTTRATVLADENKALRAARKR